MIEDQIGKKFDRQDTIKTINSTIVLLNKHAQRMMYHIQIDGLAYLSDLDLGSLRVHLQQAVDTLVDEWITLTKEVEDTCELCTFCALPASQQQRKHPVFRCTNPKSPRYKKTIKLNDVCDQHKPLSQPTRRQ